MALAPAADQLSLTPVGRMVFFAGNRSLPVAARPRPTPAQLLTGFAAAPGVRRRRTGWPCSTCPPTCTPSTQPVLFLQGTADPITGQVLRYLPLIPHARAQADARPEPCADLGRPGRPGEPHQRVPAAGRGLTSCGCGVRGAAQFVDPDQRDPGTINAPPTSCMQVGNWPSSSQANSTANSTSVSPTNERASSRGRRVAEMPSDVGDGGGHQRQPDHRAPAS